MTSEMGPARSFPLWSVPGLIGFLITTLILGAALGTAFEEDDKKTMGAASSDAAGLT